MKVYNKKCDLTKSVAAHHHDSQRLVEQNERQNAMRIRVDASSIIPGESAGIETYTYGLLNGLAAISAESMRVEVTIAQNTGSMWLREVPDEKVSWSEVELPLSASRPLGRRLRKLLPAQAQRSALAARMSWALRNRANPVQDDADVTVYPFSPVPVRAPRSIVVLHDLRRFRPNTEPTNLNAMIRENVSRAGAVVTSWPHPYQHALETFPEARFKTAMIPLPVFNPPPPGIQPNSDPALLLFPSATGPDKNHPPLLEAMALLPELCLVCPGPLVEPQAGVLLSRTSQLDLRGRVSFPGFVTSDELVSIYARATAVVVPSIWEAASGAIFEAFSWGLPVACADVAPLRAQVAFSGAEVCFFDPADPQSIRDAVRRLLADRDRYAAASRLAGQRLATRTWRSTAEDYRAVFEWVAGGQVGSIPKSPFASLRDVSQLDEGERVQDNSKVV
ncbi:glycosyltransferase [Micromonospora sp. DH14]|uniref:glycosyltransferase n=1 Tax=Micromonospora sp. DH14 TaxID=3040120 RepID=UPI00244137A2|nr:glycosyltransferase [Micromonospora sp. DH14]MDG9675553.1 glycosyltransferase [Micromonospora sp. DH14]